jgi:hypothetical protein
MTDEIVADALAERYRAACNKAYQGREQWIEGTLELAAVLVEARNRYPDHRAFSAWVERNALPQINKNDRTALLGMGEDVAAARVLLVTAKGSSVDWIWRNRPNRTLPSPRKGVISPGARASGHKQRQRAKRIPDVMRERPVRPIVAIKGLTREEVDPDFQGDAIAFAAEYGPVTLHTKAEIKENKRQDELQKWLGAAANAAKAADAFAALPRPAALDDWLEKPGKAAKKSGWQDSFERAAEVLQPTSPAGETEARSKPANDFIDIDLGEIPF